MIFHTPELDLEDSEILSSLQEMRDRLRDSLRTPRRWQGVLRRSLLARAIRGSNSIEGYHVEIDDAAAALDDEEPLSADDRTFAEIRGYRQALGYVLAMASDAHFRLDASAIRSMHFMMLSHDLSKSPGQYRTGPIYVYDDADQRTVYEAPPADIVPTLMAELIDALKPGEQIEPLVRGAMAHLNLVMIHPFRDGNGRMARALQTLVLSRDRMAEPAFSSIEEWLGANTEDYYRILAITGQGAWHPESDAHLWVKFCLRAHHMQAQTLDHRLAEAAATWTALDELRASLRFPDRCLTELYDATLGFRIRRSSHVKRAAIEERTASRDLARLVELGLLNAVGETKGRHYVAAEALRQVRRHVVRTRTPLMDPYPWLPAHLLQNEPHAQGQAITTAAPHEA
jgi:Fic family protein